MRWNLQRSEDSMERVGEKVPRSFDISLKHRLNALSSAIHNEPALSNFCTPPAYTREIIGVSYLRSQTGDVQPGEVQELDIRASNMIPNMMTERSNIPKSQCYERGGNVTLHIRACYIYGLDTRNRVVT